jgi:hypothetical protein
MKALIGRHDVTEVLVPVRSGLTAMQDQYSQ